MYCSTMRDFGYRRNQMGEEIKWQTSLKKQSKPPL